jgi:protection-of-telomeres protein 1
MSARTKFTPLRDASSAGDGACFLGVLIDKRGPLLASGRWQLELTIQDQFGPGSDARSTLKTRIRRQNVEQLPEGGNCGDIVILRHMKMETYQQMPQATTAMELQSEVVFFATKSIPTPDFIHPYSPGGLSKLPVAGTYINRPSAYDQVDVIHFKHAMAPFLTDIKNTSITPMKKPPTAPRINKKLCELKDMGLGEFHDLVAEVVKTYPVDYTTFDLYVTDYTTNKDLFLYEDPEDSDDMYSFSPQKKWTGPIGQMTMAIRLWEPHASYAREHVREGNFVFLQNVHTKLSQASKLEGAIHQDTRYPDKVCIRVCTRPEQMATVKARKEVYEKERGQRKVGEDAVANLPKKPSAKAAAKRKEEKKERQRLQKELEQQELEKKAEEIDIAKAGINPHGESNFGLGDRLARILSDPTAFITLPNALALTSVVRAGHVEKKISSIGEILNNPYRTTMIETGKLELCFINCKYRVRIRVIDFWPIKLCNFARSVNDPKYGNSNLSTEERERYKDKFEWNFALLVEDADAPVGKTPERLKLTIGDKQGQGLLKMDACK